jgi:hypothetical protein
VWLRTPNKFVLVYIRYLATTVSSGCTIPALRRHVTLHLKLLKSVFSCGPCHLNIYVMKRK